MLYVLCFLTIIQIISSLDISLGPITSTGNYDIYVDKVKYFPASNSSSVSFHHEGITYSAAAKNDMNLLKALNKDVISNGVDQIGAYTAHTTHWVPSYTKKNISMITTAKVYSDSGSIVFTQTFPHGANVSHRGSDSNGISTSFPAIDITTYEGGKRGCLAYGGHMVGNRYKVGLWEEFSLNSGIGGTEPFVVFDLDKKTSIAAVFSAFENAFAINQKFDSATRSVAFGMMSDVEEIPVGYELSTLVSFVEGGVNAAMMNWGDVFLGRFGKHRHAAWEKDLTLQYLGYSTDHGAYYWYLSCSLLLSFSCCYVES